MVDLYCRDLHAGRGAVCADCAALAEYALARLDKCAFGPEKPKCVACPVHCYQPAMRAAIREVMRYAGPRMLVAHPVLALSHTLDSVRHRPEKAKR